MSYYDRFNADGTLKSWQQQKKERETSQQREQSSSVLQNFMNIFKSLFK